MPQNILIKQGDICVVCIHGNIYIYIYIKACMSELGSEKYMRLSGQNKIIRRTNSIAQIVRRTNIIAQIVRRTNSIAQIVCRTNSIAQIVCRTNSIAPIVRIDA